MPRKRNAWTKPDHQWKYFVERPYDGNTHYTIRKYKVFHDEEYQVDCRMRYYINLPDDVLSLALEYDKLPKTKKQAALKGLYEWLKITRSEHVI